MRNDEKLRRFEAELSPHIGCAFNLAYWLTRHREMAEDIAQESCLRAFRSIESLRGTDGKPWLLAIVRNTAMSSLKRSRGTGGVPLDAAPALASESEPNPETLMLSAQDRDRVHNAIAALPVEFREAIVLRELEGCSYREIADITSVPLGTVMSRLARGRESLKILLLAKERRSSDDL